MSVWCMYIRKLCEYLEKSSVLHNADRHSNICQGGVKVSWVKMFMWMFKAGEVWILHNTIKMCILVITESEINTKKIWEKKGGKNYALPTCSELIC